MLGDVENYKNSREKIERDTKKNVWRFITFVKYIIGITATISSITFLWSLGFYILKMLLACKPNVWNYNTLNLILKSELSLQIVYFIN